MRHSFLNSLLWSFCLLGIPAWAQWYETRSEHFRVITNTTMEHGQEVAHNFEQIRAVFRDQFPKLRLDSGKEVVIFVTADKETFLQLCPYWEADGRASLAGFFQDTQYRHYILLRADEKAAMKTAFHEYAHLVFELNYDFLPSWLNEGMAEYFAQVQILPQEIHLGKPYTSRLFELNRVGLMPLDDLLAADKEYTHYDKNGQQGVFYAQSWLLVHYLLLSEEGQTHQYFNKLMGSLARRLPTKAAFRQIVGDLDVVDEKLKNYLMRNQFSHFRIQSQVRKKKETYAVSLLHEGQIQSLIAAFHTTDKRFQLDDAQADKLLSYQDQAGTVENLAIAFYKAKRWEHLKQALLYGHRYEPENWLIHYISGKATTGSEQVQHLVRTIEVQPQASFAHYLLAQILRPNQKEKALELAFRASALEPSDGPIQIFLAELLAENGRYDEAIAYAQLAVRMVRNDEAKQRAIRLISFATEANGGASKATLGPVDDFLRTNTNSHLVTIFSYDRAYQSKLLNAVWKDNLEEVKALSSNAEHSAERSFFGETPLHIAAQHGHLALIPHLLKGKIPLDVQDQSGCTAVLLAAQAGHKEIVRALADAGASLDLPDHNGTTPLMWAAFSGHQATAKLLMNKKCDRNKKDKQGRTAMDYVHRYKHKDLLRLMKLLRVKKGKVPLTQADRDVMLDARLVAMKTLWEEKGIRDGGEPLASTDKDVDLLTESDVQTKAAYFLKMGESQLKDNPSAAEKYLVKALEMDEVYVPQAHFHLGQLYFSQSRFKDAIDAYTRFLNTEPMGKHRTITENTLKVLNELVENEKAFSKKRRRKR